VDAVATWLRLLREWNARIDLTAARSEDELDDLMLADARFLAEHVPQGVRVVDVGSGAGAPGLALALLRPDLHVTLVEPLTKRVAFLRTVLGTVQRTDVVVRKERVPGVRGDWDVAISRATLPPAAWIPIGLGLAPSAWALLAREEPPDVEGAVLLHDATYAWPRTGKPRRAVHYARRPA
jgi:16S rRNA (guanine527-N7)-methyltransferase